MILIHSQDLRNIMDGVTYLCGYQFIADSASLPISPVYVNGAMWLAQMSQKCYTRCRSSGNYYSSHARDCHSSWYSSVSDVTRRIRRREKLAFASNWRSRESDVLSPHLSLQVLAGLVEENRFRACIKNGFFLLLILLADSAICSMRRCVDNTWRMVMCLPEIGLIS